MKYIEKGRSALKNVLIGIITGLINRCINNLVFVLINSALGNIYFIY